MSKYKLHGFSSPACTSPSFLTPIFEKDGTLYVQLIDERDLIKGFEKVSASELKSIQGNSDIECESGSDALFGVSDDFHEVTYNTRSQLKHYLRSKILNYIDKPFFYKEVSDFCEQVIPEFYGCETNKDFLIRQVISNLIPEFVERSGIRLGKKEQKKIQSSSFLQLSELFNNNVDSKIKLTSDYDSLQSTYESFVYFATEKHRKLSEYNSLRESLEIAGDVFSTFVDNDSNDFTSIRNDLTYFLDSKIESMGIDDNKYKPKNSKAMRKYYSNSFVKSNISENTKVTTGGLSFIIYVTSRFTQEAQKRTNNEDEILHITNNSS